MNYAAAKGGLTAMSKSLAQELASRGITVNCVAPGLHPHRDDRQCCPTRRRTRSTRRIPMGRMGEGEDIGAAVAYLASKEAGYVTGQTLHVNGGMAMICAEAALSPANPGDGALPPCREPASPLRILDEFRRSRAIPAPARRRAGGARG